MLYLVLTLVIGAFALLIAALTTANTVWAWVSVALSVFAAATLVFDWLRGRRLVAGTSVPPAPAEPVEYRPPEDSEPTRVTEEIPVVPPEEKPPPREPEPVDEAEPDEEATDAADLLIVSELGVEVRVVDERPRYHLAACAWLSGKPTLPLPVSEARQLGFTPCARCGPDAVLAARERSAKGAER